MKTLSTPTKYFLAAVAVFVLLVLNIYSVKALEFFGSPPLFALALLLELVLFLAFIFCVVRSLAAPESVILSLLVSAWGGLATNHYVRRVTNSQSAFVLWAKRRLERNNPFGLPLTITVLLSLYFLFNFVSIMLGVTSKNALTQVDVRVLNLIPSIRTVTQTTLLSFVTTVANTESAIVLMVAAAIVFLRKRQKLLAGLVVFVAAGEESVTYVLKHIVHRMRPPEILQLIREDSFSFPSGHTVRATVLFGLLAYFIYKSCETTRARVVTVAVYVTAVFLVAVSRVYLGVHYPSDVWGSILLGSAMLTLVIGAVEICSRYAVINRKKLVISNRLLLVVPAVVILFAVVAARYLIHFQPSIETPAFTTIQQIDEQTVQRLPHYSETLTGSRMEPVNFIYVGYQSQIENVFESHGWYKADASTVGNTLRAVAVGFQGRQYLTAPVTPSYLNFKPENIAFEQATATHSLRQRHHTRLWRTTFAMADGRPIWEATASFDEGVELAGSAKLPTHHIDPNIDAERAYIVQSLGYKSNLIHVVEPQLGKNASGDSFFTDGNAEIINLQ